MRSGFSYQDETYHWLAQGKMEQINICFAKCNHIFLQSWYKCTVNSCLLGQVWISSSYMYVLVMIRYVRVSLAGKQEIGYPILQTGLSECLGKVNMGTWLPHPLWKKADPQRNHRHMLFGAQPQAVLLLPSGTGTRTSSPSSAPRAWVVPRAAPCTPLHHALTCGAKKGFQQYFESG